ncbi:MAG: hypothetical protein CSB49_03870 [Proteobacteria bacterium]|nr:MAG: hypothetical protein CSB49_03870 [Pseudomonadota bacterium]
MTEPAVNSPVDSNDEARAETSASETETQTETQTSDATSTSSTLSEGAEMDISLLTRLLGERRGLALLALGAFITLFMLVALAQGGAWVACFGAMAIVYGVAFFGVAAEWFWGRWFAMGIATSGLTMAAIGLVTNGFSGGLIVWGVMHAAIYLPLIGSDMAQRYELQKGWRERWQLDDAGVARIKRAVHSAATALPTLIVYTLAPRPDRGMLLGVLALGVLGVVGLLRLRTWGVFALAGSAIGVAISTLSVPCCGATYAPLAGVAFPAASIGLLAALLLGCAVAPFAGPAFRFIRGR